MNRIPENEMLSLPKHTVSADGVLQGVMADSEHEAICMMIAPENRFTGIDDSQYRRILLDVAIP